MDASSGDRQLWLRLLLALGIMWGFIPLITVLFIFRGAEDTTFDILAAVLNSLTILPACVLAFWHRRLACIWLTVNAAILLAAFASFANRTHIYGKGGVVGLAGSVFLAICLDLAELKRWPGALDH